MGAGLRSAGFRVPKVDWERTGISRAVREDLHALQRTVTPGGQLTYRAAQTSDGQQTPTPAAIPVVRRKPRREVDIAAS